MNATLFEVEHKRKWTGSLTLVPLPRDACPRCGGIVHVTTTEQPALFVHGGFSATLASTDRWCPSCKWSLGALRQERRPDRRAA